MSFFPPVGGYGCCVFTFPPEGSPAAPEGDALAVALLEYNEAFPMSWAIVSR